MCSESSVVSACIPRSPRWGCQPFLLLLFVSCALLLNWFPVSIQACPDCLKTSTRSQGDQSFYTTSSGGWGDGKKKKWPTMADQSKIKTSKKSIKVEDFEKVSVMQNWHRSDAGEVTVLLPCALCAPYLPSACLVTVWVSSLMKCLYICCSWSAELCVVLLLGCHL